MKTVKDVSELTGISIRTLRYYDEIGWLKPTQVTDAEYRLYDDSTLAKMEEIMFFKGLDTLLHDIKTTPFSEKCSHCYFQKNLRIFIHFLVFYAIQSTAF